MRDSVDSVNCENVINIVENTNVQRKLQTKAIVYVTTHVGASLSRYICTYIYIYTHTNIHKACLGLLINTYTYMAEPYEQTYYYINPLLCAYHSRDPRLRSFRSLLSFPRFVLLQLVH